MNKETLQNYNERLNINNASLDDVVNIIDGLPSLPELAEKSITENGTYAASDDGLGGYSSVKVNVIDKYKPTGHIRFEGNKSTDFLYEVSHLDTSNLTHMNNMFYNTSVTNLDLSEWDVSKVTTMQQMFYMCSSLKSVNISNWDTSACTTMSTLFMNCNALTDITGLSGLNVSNVTICLQMFSNCQSLTELDLSTWDFASIKNISNFFSSCTSLSSISLPTISSTVLTDIGGMFAGCKSLTNLKIPNMVSNSINDIADLFNGCSGATSVDLSNFPANTGSYLDVRNIFAKCSLLTHIDMSYVKSSRVQHASGMFNGCTSAQFIDISGLTMTSSYTITYNDMFTGVPDDCEIIVKNDAAKTFIQTHFANLTNIKTLAEYEAA